MEGATQSKLTNCGHVDNQECIPVGCVLPGAVAVHGTGGGGSASAHAGIYNPPWVWAWIPLGYGPGDHPGCRPGEPSLGVGLGDPPGQTPQLPLLGVGLETLPHARHAGIPPARHAGIPHPHPL